MIPAKAFQVLVTNFSNRTVRLRKSQVLGHALPSPEAIFALEEGEGVQEPSLKEIEVSDWKDIVHIGVQCHEDRQKLIYLLEAFQEMCSGKRDTINATENRIQLVSGEGPIHQQPYRAEVKAREMERQELNRCSRKG